jgi:hypothetical protein
MTKMPANGGLSQIGGRFADSKFGHFQREIADSLSRYLKYSRFWRWRLEIGFDLHCGAAVVICCGLRPSGQKNGEFSIVRCVTGAALQSNASNAHRRALLLQITTKVCYGPYQKSRN